MKRSLICLISLFLLAAMFVSCGGSDYRDDVTVKELSDVAMKKISIEKGYFEADEDVFTDDFGGADYVDSYMIMNSNDTKNINEYGIFHVSKSGKAKEMRDTVNSYIDGKKNNPWYEDYFPEQVPKLNAAEVRVYGNYVVYVIAESERKADFFGAIEDMLKK